MVDALKVSEGSSWAHEEDLSSLSVQVYALPAREEPEILREA